MVFAFISSSQRHVCGTCKIMPIAHDLWASLDSISAAMAEGPTLLLPGSQALSCSPQIPLSSPGPWRTIRMVGGWFCPSGHLHCLRNIFLVLFLSAVNSLYRVYTNKLRMFRQLMYTRGALQSRSELLTYSSEVSLAFVLILTR